MLLFSAPIANLLGMPYCVLLIRILAPMVLLRTLSAVLLGYFQGEGTELPGCVSCILRQLLIMVLGCLLGDSFMGYGEKVSHLLINQQVLVMYGTAGMALAITISELVVVLLLAVIYKYNKPRYRNLSSEGMKVTDSFQRSLRILYHNMGSQMLIRVLEIIPFVVTAFIYFVKCKEMMNVDIVYGGYIVKYLAVCGLVLFPLCAICIPLFGKVAGKIRKDELRFSRSVFQAGFHAMVIWSLYFSVFVACMSERIAELFGKENLSDVTQMLKEGSFIILFMVLGFYFSQLLIVFGKNNYVLGSLVIYNIAFIGFACVFFNVTRLGILSLVYSGLAGRAVYALMTGFLVCRQFRSGIKALYMLLIPLAGASGAGIISLLLGGALAPLVGSGAALVICLLISFLCYLLIILFLRNIKEQELEYMPGGRLFACFGEWFHVL